MEIRETIFVPEKTSIKKGTDKNGKFYTKFGVKDANGAWYGSFNKDVFDIIFEAERRKKQVRILYIENGEFKNIKEALMESQQGSALELAERLAEDAKKLQRDFQALLAKLKE